MPDPLLRARDMVVDLSKGPRNSRSVQIIDSVFRLRRHLARLLKDAVLGGSGITLEDADLLLALFGARLFEWSNPTADADGFVSLSELRRSPIDGAVLTRRISDLKSEGFVELTRARRGESKRVRISDKGIKFFQPYYVVYSRLADRVLQGVSTEEIDRFFNMNEFLIQRLQWKV